MKKKKIVIDIALNITATAIPVFVLQLIILPNLSKFMDSDKYGLLVTILALLNVIPATFGNSLNNIRLIYGNDNRTETQPADYNVLLLLLAIVNLIVVSAFAYYYDKEITPVSMILTLIISVLWLMREYHIVAFRIKLNYVYIVVNNLIMVAGYLLGYVLFRLYGRWQMIYILGQLSSLIFIFLKSELWREPFKISPDFGKITGQTALLISAGFLTRVTSYADKLLIFPILGGAMVSIYYASTLFGKIVSLTITPISAVMLSYLSKSKKKNDSSFRSALLLSACVCTVGYFVCLFISRPVLALLYPQFVDEAMKYIRVTTGTTVLVAMISIINPFVLNYFDMRWQMVINGTYVLIYVSFSLFLLGKFGMLGFCIGAFTATFLKLCFMLIIYKYCREKTVE